MLPDTVHFLLMLLLCGTLLRIAEYLMADRAPDNRLYKFLVFSY
jgi:hypothetical protein